MAARSAKTPFRPANKKDTLIHAVELLQSGRRRSVVHRKTNVPLEFLSRVNSDKQRPRQRV